MVLDLLRVGCDRNGLKDGHSGNLLGRNEHLD